MHVAGKVFLGLGVVIMLLGAVMTWPKWDLLLR